VTRSAKPPVAVLDYRMGNLRSVQKALESVGAHAWIASHPEDIRGAKGLVLPGVGAFGDAMDRLRELGFTPVIMDAVDKRQPILGICVGMQVLFEGSTEMGQHEGLAILPGLIVRFPRHLMVPHVGWNQIHIRRPHSLVSSVNDGDYGYFTHSYYPAPSDERIVIAETDYDIFFASIVAQDNVFGIQFHPEKSWRVGLAILHNFVAMLR